MSTAAGTNSLMRSYVRFADHTYSVAGGRPILTLDMYEHAYHTKYGASAAAYVDAFMAAVRWDNVAVLFNRYSKES